MTEAPTHRRERSLEWIAREFQIYGRSMAEALRSGARVEREAALVRMEASACAERARGLAGHWTYDLARHTELVRIIERERALIAAEDLKAARSRYQAAGRHVRCQLHRRGWASVSLLRRLGKARGGLLAAIAGRCAQEDAHEI
jgi:hypothetical protein